MSTSEGPAVHLVEIFGSAQGEGPFVGRSTVFVRFGECDLRCRWCDSPGTWRRTARCRIAAPGGGPDHEVANPVPFDTIVDAIRALRPVKASFVSLTGGEPLLQPAACRALATWARGAGLRAHLETHGLAADALGEVVDAVDVISMDWKLERDVHPADASSPRDFEAGHRAFLAVAARAEGLYVKVVITEGTTAEELDPVCRALNAIAPNAPLVLQPVTPFGRVTTRPSAALLLGLLRHCEERVADVRLIPQTHPIYGAR